MTRIDEIKARLEQFQAARDAYRNARPGDEAQNARLEQLERDKGLAEARMLDHAPDDLRAMLAVVEAAENVSLKFGEVSSSASLARMMGEMIPSLDNLYIAFHDFNEGDDHK